MKEKLKLINTILAGILIVLTLAILGAEPSGTGEEALARYQESCEEGMPYVLGAWISTAVALSASIAATVVISRKK